MAHGITVSMYPSLKVTTGCVIRSDQPQNWFSLLTINPRPTDRSIFGTLPFWYLAHQWTDRDKDLCVVTLTVITLTFPFIYNMSNSGWIQVIDGMSKADICLALSICSRDVIYHMINYFWHYNHKKDSTWDLIDGIDEFLFIYYFWGESPR